MNIEATRESLEVNIDADSASILMRGVSMPESPLEFFKPIFEVIEKDILKTEKEINVDMEIVYFNSVSY